ncbi:putative protein S-acyltransferase 12 [Vitis vinifera]|uniref:Uncharacterized protein n=1 Tax=Vitis vinifera TaxID=29760 RepID=A0A438D9B0_VITVI|nr:putative protein S-acyltransferase 12 [Vitis vinifera]
MGNQRKPNCLLMEVCKIIEGQRYSKRLNERQIIALPKGYLLSSSYISMHGETMTPWKYTAKGKNLFLRHEDQRNFGLEQLADRNLISFYERSNIPDGAHGYPVINLAFALSLLCFIVMHVSFLSSNTTSIEVYDKRRAVRWKYDLGRKTNFEQVFGKKKALWLFPLYSEDDFSSIPALNGLKSCSRAIH